MNIAQNHWHNISMKLYFIMVTALNKITQPVFIKSYLVITYAISCKMLTRNEVIQTWIRFEHPSRSLPYSAVYHIDMAIIYLFPIKLVITKILLNHILCLALHTKWYKQLKLHAKINKFDFLIFSKQAPVVTGLSRTRIPRLSMLVHMNEAGFQPGIHSKVKINIQLNIYINKNKHIILYTSVYAHILHPTYHISHTAYPRVHTLISHRPHLLAFQLTSKVSANDSSQLKYIEK